MISVELEGAQAMELGRLLATVASGSRGAWAALGGRWTPSGMAGVPPAGEDSAVFFSCL